MHRRAPGVRAFAALLLAGASLPGPGATATDRGVPAAETVYFASGDGRTELVGYLVRPDAPGPRPAVVLLHGRTGPYASNVRAGCTLVARGQSSACDAASLSRRHAMWATFWVEHGYLALVVDSFGPRGRAHGYGRGTHDDPDRAEVNERDVRPLDAEAALRWLAARGDVAKDRILLQGWSNGGSTTLNVMARQAGRSAASGTMPRFRAALAFYPGCGPRALPTRDYRVDAPLRVFLAADDAEVSPTVCARVLDAARRAAGVPIEVTVYPGATHDFDDPGPVVQALAGNRSAKDDAMRRSLAFFDALP